MASVKLFLYHIVKRLYHTIVFWLSRLADSGQHGNSKSVSGLKLNIFIDMVALYYTIIANYINHVLYTI